MSMKSNFDKSDSQNIPIGFNLMRTLEGHAATIHRIAWSPNGHYIASSSRDETVRIWRWESGLLEKTISAHKRWVNAVAWSPDSAMLATGSESGNIRIWKTATWEQLYEINEHRSRIEDLAWSKDGRLVASASGDGTIRIAWLIFALEMLVLGIIMLYAAREPARNEILVLTVAILELVRGAGGDFLWMTRGWPTANYIPFMIVHLIIAFTGIYFLRQESAKTSG